MTDLIRPECICYDCGLEYGTKFEDQGIRWKAGKCGWCDELGKPVTNPKHFYHQLNDQYDYLDTSSIGEDGKIKITS